jgi:hypothetical protein
MDKTNIHQGDELSAAFNDINLNLTFVLVVLKREGSKRVNALRPAEFWNSEVDGGFASCFAIKIEIPARYTEVLLL